MEEHATAFALLLPFTWTEQRHMDETKKHIIVQIGSNFLATYNLLFCCQEKPQEILKEQLLQLYNY